MLNWFKTSQMNGIIEIPNEDKNFQRLNNTTIENEWLNEPSTREENNEFLLQNDNRRIFSQNSKKPTNSFNANSEIIKSPSRQLNTSIIKNMRGNKTIF